MYFKMYLKCTLRCTLSTLYLKCTLYFLLCKKTLFTISYKEDIRQVIFYNFGTFILLYFYILLLICKKENSCEARFAPSAKPIYPILKCSNHPLYKKNTSTILFHKIVNIIHFTKLLFYKM